MNKMSWTDIMIYAMNLGVSYEDAEAIADDLSPEHRTVAESKVMFTVTRFLSGRYGKV